MIKKIIILIISLFLHSANANNVNYSYIEAKYKFYYKNIKAGEMYLKITKDKDRIEIDTLYDGNILAKLSRSFMPIISATKFCQDIYIV